ncbi:MAG: sugar ABC transporter substrate-binding protein [Eubacteriales bacterium]|nr:sugar ABC transporter substrate-binding protein [Eubacteriales bacterium]
MKKTTVGILAGVMISAAFLAGCGKNEATEAANESAETEKEGNGEDAETEAAITEAASDETQEEKEQEVLPKVGVLLPDEADERWLRDGTVMQEKLTEAGYEPEIYYADEDVSMQVSQIEGLVEEEVSALIIAPVDAYALPDVLSKAKEKSIPVFSYDRLIMDTDAVNYYTAFNSREIGQMIGNTIVKEKDLEKAREQKQSYSIEFFMGSPDDNAALFLYNGIMEVLQSYLDDGTLVCRSGRTSFDETGVMRWSDTTVKSSLSSIIQEYYTTEKRPDIICTASDLFAVSVPDVLEEAGIHAGSEEWPLITGVGCEAEAVKNVAEGKQAFSIFMDSRGLAEECVKMADTYLKGEKPEVKDYEQYDNGKKIIGTYTYDVQLIDKDNYQLLIDNGYYTEDEIKPEAMPSGTPVPAGTPGEDRLTGTPVPSEAPETEGEEGADVTPGPSTTPKASPVPSDTPAPDSEADDKNVVTPPVPATV